MKRSFTVIEDAIAEARARRDETRKHYAVVQHHDRMFVRSMYVDSARNPMWTTKEDDREKNGETRRYHRILKEDVGLVLALHADSMPIAVIARKFEVSKNAVLGVLRKNSLAA